MSGFRDDQIEALEDLLDEEHIRTRTVDGTELSYVEGWFTIAEANRIFGFDGWDWETVHFACVWQGRANGQCAASYVAKVRVTVRASRIPVMREGTGFGTGTGDTPGAAHENALKEAETDAMKRALATFGNRFGLALYDKAQKGVRRSGSRQREQPDQWQVRSPQEGLSTVCNSVEEFFSELRRELEQATNFEAVRTLWSLNEDSLRLARETYPDLKDKKGNHYAAVFNRLCQKRVAELKQEPTATDTPAPPPEGIDKSVLVIGVPRRIRDPEHLRYVAANPCLVCGRQPAQAHHLTFMQPRARGLKSSDEWTVPLCVIHHRELHDRGDERAFWADKGLDPVKTALTLWSARVQKRYGRSREAENRISAASME